MPNGTYSGRLMADGNGNLLADQSTKIGEETLAVHDRSGNPILDGDGQQVVLTVPIFKYGENHGMPVALKDGEYKFLAPGEPSHNDLHHERFVSFESTTDETQTDDPSLVNADKKTGLNLHHFVTQKDDPHYDDSAPNKTRVRQLPDAVAPTTTGHTEAYVNGR